MKFVSVTLARDNAAVIGETLTHALALVDECVLVDTGSKDDTLERARAAVGSKIRVVQTTWKDSFALARTHLLHAAAEFGADVAVMVDSDERLELSAPRESVRSEIEKALAQGIHVLLVPQGSGCPDRERIFRIPCPGRWVGRTHEVHVDHGPHPLLSSMSIHERVHKNPAQLVAKRTRDQKLLKLEIQDHPEDGRWHFYLAEAHAGLGENAQAHTEYVRSGELSTWDEEKAYAWYRAGWLAEPDWGRALECASRGLAVRADFPELSWLAAFAHYKMRNFLQAIVWAELSIVLQKKLAGGVVQDTFPRVGFSDPSGLREGPYNVLRWSYWELGKKDESDRADRVFKQMTGDFESGPRGPQPKESLFPELPDRISEMAGRPLPAVLAARAIDPAGFRARTLDRLAARVGGRARLDELLGKTISPQEFALSNPNVTREAIDAAAEDLGPAAAKAPYAPPKIEDPDDPRAVALQEAIGRCAPKPPKGERP